MVKKWSVSYPAVNGVEQRRVYVYLPTMYLSLIHISEPTRQSN